MVAAVVVAGSEQAGADGAVGGDGDGSEAQLGEVRGGLVFVDASRDEFGQPYLTGRA